MQKEHLDEAVVTNLNNILRSDNSGILSKKKKNK